MFETLRIARRYLLALSRSRNDLPYPVKIGDDQVDFLTWADQYINQLDPLHPEPRHPDMQPDDDKSYYRALAEQLKKVSTSAQMQSQADDILRLAKPQ